MREEKLDYIRNWIFRAREDFSVIESLEKSGLEFYTSTICFHSQQVVEKYLKAFLIFHDVDFLLSECKKIDEENFIFDLKSLTEFGVSVRYPDDFYIPGVKETKEYIEIAEGVKYTIELLLKAVLDEK